MKYLSSKEIRNIWISFFASKQHQLLESAPLVPRNDPTLLWMNSGVAALKKYFDGSEVPDNKRIVSIQKCIRTNDIDNVGQTARHHTFFEMLGNFSIGDYFKKEAINFAFELLTSHEYFDIPLEKLYFTYYPSDLETKKYWLDLGIKEEHLFPVEDNFWLIGDGPCGPDSEIFFDRGREFDIRGPELIKNDINNDRYVEIWNLVFSQFNAKEGLKREEYPELPHKNIDTGAGFERLVAIFQNGKTNFDTDLFLPIMRKIEEITGIEYNGQLAFKVIADHIKALVFAISDGAVISNEGRGYVLRRLLRRAVKYARTLGINKPALYLLIPTVISIMSDVYSDLVKYQDIVETIIKKEEEKFFLTVSEGEKQVSELIKLGSISAIDAFKLFDTYGFPIELSLEYASEAGIKIDIEGFYLELEKQRKRSRSARTTSGSMKIQEEEYLAFFAPSEFIGYDTMEVSSEVIGVFDEGIVVRKTPFYATSGGQVCDKGVINGCEVLEVVKMPNGQHLHKVAHKFHLNDKVSLAVERKNRMAIARNHTATHLLQKALKNNLGDHVNQHGSYVGSSNMRFDFNNYDTVSDNMLLKIEKDVNDVINKSLPVKTEILPLEEARSRGAMALFGEKYGSTVRVVDATYSLELCGGTHVTNTSQIKKFAITSRESIGSGIFRIEGISGDNLDITIKKYLEKYILEINELISKNSLEYVLPKIKGSYQDIINYRAFVEELKEVVKRKNRELSKESSLSILANATSFVPKDGRKEIIITTNDLEIPVLKQLIDVVFDKAHANVVFAINITIDKATFICKSSIGNAKELVNYACSLTTGTGGGKPDMAQGGTKDLNKIASMIEALEKLWHI